MLTTFIRHTDEMIEKLKKAGLGYYVKDDNTQQKFGKYSTKHYLYVLFLIPCMVKCKRLTFYACISK